MYSTSMPPRLSNRSMAKKSSYFPARLYSIYSTAACSANCAPMGYACHGLFSYRDGVGTPALVRRNRHEIAVERILPVRRQVRNVIYERHSVVGLASAFC